MMPKKNIVRNARVLLDCIQNEFSGNNADVFEFLTFLVQKCCLVVVSTPSQKSAFRIFSVMNNRGLDLLPSDILKADIIGKIDDRKDEYAQKWEDLEQELGRNRFNELFAHIRMIKLKNKARRSVLEELQEFVVPRIASIRNFIDDELFSYASALRVLKNGNYRADNNQFEINQYIYWLNQVSFSEWLPAAILFLHQKPDAHQSVEFFRHLEILTSYLHLSAKYTGKRIERYGSILKDLQKNPKQCSPSLFLDDEEKQSFRELLDGNIYNGLTAVRRNYLILRLDAMISDGAANYKNASGLLTIEHVLPQTIGDNGQWRQWWKKDEDGGDTLHQTWLHRLANLIPLNKRRNSAASNLDFAEKKEKYFSGNKNVSSYALASKVLQENEWTPEVVEARQKELLDCLYRNWLLKTTD